MNLISIVPKNEEGETEMEYYHDKLTFDCCGVNLPTLLIISSQMGEEKKIEIYHWILSEIHI